MASTWSTCQYVMTGGGHSRGMINGETDDRGDDMPREVLEDQELIGSGPEEGST